VIERILRHVLLCVGTKNVLGKRFAMKQELNIRDDCRRRDAAGMPDLAMRNNVARIGSAELS
jgi:hypothetical protein